MKNDVDQNCVAFHSQAARLLMSLYKQFQHSISLLDRQGDENVFQQLQGNYARQLKQQLQYLATNMLGNVEPGVNSMQLNGALSHIIEEYVHEFNQKVKSL